MAKDYQSLVRVQLHGSTKIRLRPLGVSLWHLDVDLSRGHCDTGSSAEDEQ